MAHELEEERRRDKFYNIDPSLSDEDYFKELGAKDEALVRLTTRLQTQSDLATVLGAGRASDSSIVQVTYLNSDNSDNGLQAAQPSQVLANGGRDRVSWRPRFYIEVSSSAQPSPEDATGSEPQRCGAIGEAVFERSGAEWVPTCLSIHATAKHQHLVDVCLPLPHGLKYVSLRSISNP